MSYFPYGSSSRDPAGAPHYKAAEKKVAVMWKKITHKLTTYENCAPLYSNAGTRSSLSVSIFVLFHYYEMLILVQPHNANTTQISTPNGSQRSRQAWWVCKREWFNYVRIQKVVGAWLFETPLSTLQKMTLFANLQKKLKVRWRHVIKNYTKIKQTTFLSLSVLFWYLYVRRYL